MGFVLLWVGFFFEKSFKVVCVCMIVGFRGLVDSGFLGRVSRRISLFFEMWFIF